MKTTTCSKAYFCILLIATSWIGLSTAQTDPDTINSPALPDDNELKEGVIPSINATSQTTLPAEEAATTTLTSPAEDLDNDKIKTSNKTEEKPDDKADAVPDNTPEDPEGTLLPPVGSTIPPEVKSLNTTSKPLEGVGSNANKSLTDNGSPALNSTSDNIPTDESDPIPMVNSTSDNTATDESDPIPMVNATDTDINNVSSTTKLPSVGINGTVTDTPAVNATEASGNVSLTPLSPTEIGNSTTPSNGTTTLSTIPTPSNVTNITTPAITTNATTMTTTTESTTSVTTSATTTTESTTTTTTTVAPITDPITPFPPIKSETCRVLECFWAVETGSDYISFIAHESLTQPDKVLVSLSYSPSEDATSENVTDITDSKDKYRLEGLDPDSEWFSCISLSKDDGSPILQKECHKVRTQTVPKAAGFNFVYIIIIVACFIALGCLIAIVVACRLRQLKKQKTKKKQRSSWGDEESGGVEMRERYEMRPLRPQTNVVSLYENQRQPLANLTSFNPSAKPIPEEDTVDGNVKVDPNSNETSAGKTDDTRKPSEGDFTDEEWDENFDDDTGGQGDVVAVKLGDSFRQPKPLEIIPKATSEAGGSSVQGGDSEEEEGEEEGEAKETDALVREDKVSSINVGSEHSMSSFKS